LYLGTDMAGLKRVKTHQKPAQKNDLIEFEWSRTPWIRSSLSEEDIREEIH